MTAYVPHGANGTLPINLGLKHAFMRFSVIGGPFDYRAEMPGPVFGVCVRAERVPPTGVDVYLPIRDFDVPSDAAAVSDAIRETLRAALAGETVYVGCMGGWGRTGLFMALLAKAAGIGDPVDYVRKHYTPRAIETKEQYAYVAGFDVTELRRWLVRQAWKQRLRRLLR